MGGASSAAATHSYAASSGADFLHDVNVLSMDGDLEALVTELSQGPDRVNDRDRVCIWNFMLLRI